MLVSTADVTAVIEGVAQRYGGRLIIYLPASPYVDFTRALSSVNVSAQMNTDLPDGVRDTAGLSTLTGDIVISGSVDPHGDVTKSAAWLFNPDSLDSPLRHLTVNDCKITYEEGPYVAGSADPQYLPVSGECWINGYDLNHETGDVVFHVTDLPPEFDVAPSIPSVITTPPFNAGLTSEFVMDAAIRSMYGDSTWPATRPQCVLAIGGRTSAWAEVGRLIQNTYGTPAFVPGVFGSALSPVGDIAAELPYQLEDTLADDIYVEGWYSHLATVAGGGGVFLFAMENSTFSTGDRVSIQINADSITVRPFLALSSPGSGVYTVSIPSAASHYVGVKVNWPIGGGNWSVTLDVDGTLHSSGSLSVGFTRTGACGYGMVYGVATAGQQVGFEGVQFTAETAPASNAGFTPRAILDPSLNPLTVCPPVPADTKGWDLLQTVAAAECGYIRKTRDGIIRFTNRVNMLNAAVGRAISNTSLRTFQTTVPAGNAKRRINVPYTEWEFGDPTVIFNLQSRKKIPANSTVTWRQTLTDGALAAAVDSPATLLPDGHDPTDGGSYYRSAADRAGAANGPHLTITVTQPSPDVLEISVQNKSSRHAWLTTPGDTYTDFDVAENGHGLWIGGTPVTAGDEATVTCTYGDGKGEFDFTSNPYLQDHDTAVAVGNFLLGQLFMDIRDFTSVSIVPDHRIEISDLDRLVNPDPSGVDEYIIVWGIAYSAEFPPAGQDGGSRDMTLDTRALGPPDAWLGGAIPDRAEVDESWAYA